MTGETEAARQAWWMSPVGLIVLILVLRVVALLVFSPLGLVYDEAHYWEWSRRPDLSYYTKGPGVAWAIFASTWVFGTSVWSVKLPAVIASAVLMLVGARLGWRISGGRREAAWYVVVALAVMPGYVVTSMLLTTDIFYSALWLMAIWCAYEALYGERSARQRVLWWAGCGFVLGLAALFKYTAVLLVPGILLACLLGSSRRDERSVGKCITGAILPGIAGILPGVVSFSPVLIWNMRQGWPTVSHQLGRVGAPGGDEQVTWAWSWMYGPEFWGAQIGLLAVVGVVLIVLSIRWAMRRRTEDVQAWEAHRFLIVCALPILLFYLVLSIFVRAQGNWALAGYSSLLVLVGLAASEQMPKFRKRVRQWKAKPAPRPHEGFLRKKPETLFQVSWHWFVGAGVAIGLILVLGPWFMTLPGLRDLPGAEKLAERLQGRPTTVNAIETQRQALIGQGIDPLIVCDSYQKAGLLAFYLPDRPRTFSAVSLLGGRPSAYDFFKDTDLTDPSLRGADLLLIGGTEERWQEALRFDSIEKVSADPTMFLARGYAGVRHGHGAKDKAAPVDGADDLVAGIGVDAGDRLADRRAGGGT